MLTVTERHGLHLLCRILEINEKSLVCALNYMDFTFGVDWVAGSDDTQCFHSAESQ